MANKWDVEVSISGKRKKTWKKKLFDELSLDTRFSNTEEKFRIIVYVFNINLNTILNQLEKRFSNFHDIVNKFKVVDPNFLTHTDDSIIRTKVLMNQYPKDFSDDFIFQIISFPSTLRAEIKSYSDINSHTIYLWLVLFFFFLVLTMTKSWQVILPYEIIISSVITFPYASPY